jgi:hypothetical protein
MAVLDQEEEEPTNMTYMQETHSILACAYANKEKGNLYYLPK